MVSLYLRKKARKLVEEDRVSVEAKGSSLYFIVRSTRVHEVIYNGKTKRWICDCPYFSVKGKECSHILAAKLYLSAGKKPHRSDQS